MKISLFLQNIFKSAEWVLPTGDYNTCEINTLKEIQSKQCLTPPVLNTLNITLVKQLNKIQTSSEEEQKERGLRNPLMV